MDRECHRSRRSQVINRCNQIEKAITKLRDIHHLSTNWRAAPITICLEGAPGVGKSTVMKHIIAQLMSLKAGGKKVTSSEANVRTYARTEDPYWSGYQPALHDCIFFDDFFSIKAETGEANYNDFLRVVNVVPALSTQAALEDKDCKPFLPDIVTLTTNLSFKAAKFEIGKMYNSYPAVLRRVDLWVTVKMQPGGS